MENEHKPPTTQAEALKMVEPLNPQFDGAYELEEVQQAYARLVEFIWLLLPE